MLKSTINAFSIAFYRSIVLAFISLLIMWFWYSGLMIHHIWDSPFNYKAADPIYYLLDSLWISKLVLYNSNSALLFDGLLVVSLLASLVFYKNLFFVRLTAILLLVYQVLLNTKMGYHAHHLFALHFALVPFWVKPKHFVPAFMLARNLACLTYFTAGFFKLYHGAWLSMESFSAVLSNQHAAYFYFNPNALRTIISQWIIQHPFVGLLFFGTSMLLQLSFFIGFWTRKYDKWFVIGIVVFHLMDWFLMNLGVFLSMISLVWLFLYQINQHKTTKSI